MNVKQKNQFLRFTLFIVVDTYPHLNAGGQGGEVVELEQELVDLITTNKNVK